ncbi:MAG: hypothetical protein I8H71_11345 [Xanthomonadaceae bacterium]|nr:hypothetical protein [Xanthomonadaceae bacterium]
MNKTTTHKPEKAAAKSKAGDEETPQTAAYTTGACPILLDGELYEPGTEILLTQAQAARLGINVTAIAAAAVLKPLE